MTKTNVPLIRLNFQHDNISRPPGQKKTPSKSPRSNLRTTRIVKPERRLPLEKDVLPSTVEMIFVSRLSLLQINSGQVSVL